MLTGAAIGASAQSKVYGDLVLTNISANGRYAASQDNGCVTLIDLETGEQTTFMGNEAGDLYYGVGNGRAISSDGIVVGSTNVSNAAYCKAGVWTVLPLPADMSFGSYSANDITPDGSLIVGDAGSGDMLDESEPMCYPCVWYRLEDGSYSVPEMLPCPTLDFSGRVPQYITAVCVSDDGNRVLGQIRDFMGYQHEPVLYTRDADGKWSYKKMCTDLINPNKLTLPPYPGDAPTPPDGKEYLTDIEYQQYLDAEKAYSQYSDNYPNVEDYATDDERLDYEDAVEEYNADPYSHPYPFLVDFLGAESRAAYDKALADYYKNMPKYPEYVDFMSPEKADEYRAAELEYEHDYAIWEEAYIAFVDVYGKIMADSPIFEFNTISISSNGRYAATTSAYDVVDPDTEGITTFSDPYIIDLDTDTATKYESEVLLRANTVFDDGTAIAVAPAVAPRVWNTAYVLMEPTGKFEPLHTVLATVNPAADNWIKQNMVHDVESYDENYQPYIIHDCYVTGNPKASADKSRIITYTENVWDFSGGSASYYSYLIDDALSGVDTIADDVVAPADATPVYYTLQGILTANPVKGQLYIKVTGNTATKVIY